MGGTWNDCKSAHCQQTDGQTDTISVAESVFLLSFNVAGNKMHLGLHVRYQILLSDFNKIWIITTYFRVSSQYQGTHKYVQ
jgi:hypothetical protein